MAELSHKVGLSKTPVQARVKRLEKDGYIRGYAGDHRPRAHGRRPCRLRPGETVRHALAALDDFNRAVQAVPEIEQCHMMASSFDYLLKVRTTRHRRLPPRARRAHLGAAACRPDLDLRGDGDGEGQVTSSLRQRLQERHQRRALAVRQAAAGGARMCPRRLPAPWHSASTTSSSEENWPACM